MKDTQVKTSGVVQKLCPKKSKMPGKKTKEQKLIPPKASKTKKIYLKNIDKKPKVTKADETETVPKRKRGRPRNEEKVQIKKKCKEPIKTVKNSNAKPGRKRKISQVPSSKSDKEMNHVPEKKIKLNDINCSMNGGMKLPFPSFHKPCFQKGVSPTVVKQPISNNSSSNGLGNCQNNTHSHSKKSASAGLKNVTFVTHPKSEMTNGSNCSKPLTNSNVTKGIRGILKPTVDTNTQSKAIPGKSVKPDNAIVPYKHVVKTHPQRMASLDAMAKLHVICIPDRKPVEHHSKSTTSVVTVCSQPFSHQKSLTQCHERIHVDVKKESKDSKGNLVHKQINYVKEKQHVIVSHSVQESSVVEQSKTISTKSQCERKKKLKTEKSQNTQLNKSQVVPASHSKQLTKGDKKPKVNKSKELDKKSSKAIAEKTSKVIKKNVKDKPLKVVSRKSKKVEQTKSEVKVKETIRMQKTCTYQSVTTVNSSGTTNSSVVPVSHVGLTTNYSKTKKTVVTDEECKNKISYSSGGLIKNSFCMTSESPCSMGHQSECCKFHSPPPMIPFAHVQTCSLSHSTSRTAEAPSSSPTHHYDTSFPVHRFSPQQALIYSSPSSECGCCCSGSLVQNVHETCLMRKGLLPYHRVPHHHAHLPSFHREHAVCGDFHRPRHFNSSSSVSCCTPCCGERHRLPYLPGQCEQTPLDLSTSAPSVEGPKSHCSTPICCGGDLLLMRSPFHRCTCPQPVEPTLDSSKESVALLSSRGTFPQESDTNFVPAKREKSLSPKGCSSKSGKRQFAHGWIWKGKPRERLITLSNDSPPVPRSCYPGIQHQEGDVIHEKDCVLLRSGPRDTDLPYVAKVAAFWESPDDGEMMMSLLWYYRPEHTEHGKRTPGQSEDEVFASRHRDTNSVACIDDKCFVLTYNEFCRYKASLSMDENAVSLAKRLVPDIMEGYPRKPRLPADPVATDIVFFCRHVYDFRQKRILKNPA